MIKIIGYIFIVQNLKLKCIKEKGERGKELEYLLDGVYNPVRNVLLQLLLAETFGNRLQTGSRTVLIRLSARNSLYSTKDFADAN